MNNEHNNNNKVQKIESKERKYVGKFLYKLTRTISSHSLILFLVNTKKKGNMLISHSRHLLSLSANRDWPLSSSMFKRHTKLTGWYKNIIVDSQIKDGTKRRMNVGIRHVCNAILPLKQVVSLDQEAVSNVIDDQITSIKSMLNSMEDGEINVSPYDTAWVALIKDVNRNNTAPLFPSCLQWIADHQLEDGSWGDGSFFGARDRMINTLACVVALKSWNAYPEKLERGT